MLAKKNEVHLLLDEKYCEMLSDLDRMQRIIEKKDAEIIELKDNFIVSIKEIEQNLHVKKSIINYYIIYFIIFFPFI